MAGRNASQLAHIHLLGEAAAGGTPRLGGRGKATVVSIFPGGCSPLQCLLPENNDPHCFEEFFSMASPDAMRMYPTPSPDFHVYGNLIDAKTRSEFCILHGSGCTGKLPEAGRVHMLVAHVRVDDFQEDLAPFFADIVRHVDVFHPTVSSILVQNVRAGALDEDRVKITVETLLKQDVAMSNVTTAGFPYSEPVLVIFAGDYATHVQETFLTRCSAMVPTVDFKSYIFKKNDPFLRGEHMRRRRQPLAKVAEPLADPPADTTEAATTAASRRRTSMTRAISVGLLPSEFTKPDTLGMDDKCLVGLTLDRREKVETHLCVLRKHMESLDCKRAIVDANAGFTKRYRLNDSSCPWIGKTSTMVLGMSKSRNTGTRKFKARLLHPQEVLGFKGYLHGTVNLALLSERSAAAVVGTAPPLPVVADAFHACLSRGGGAPC